MRIGAIIGWAALAAIFLFGLWFIFLNYYYWLYLGLVRKKHYSPIAMVGGLCCFLVLRYTPIVVDHRWAWVPLIVDPGCIFLAGLFAYSAIASRGFRETPEFKVKKWLRLCRKQREKTKSLKFKGPKLQQKKAEKQIPHLVRDDSG